MEVDFKYPFLYNSVQLQKIKLVTLLTSTNFSHLRLVSYLMDSKNSLIHTVVWRLIVLMSVFLGR